MANTNTVLGLPGVFEVAPLVVSPSGGRVQFVGSATQFNTLGETGAAIASRYSTSVSAALRGCVSGRGDKIYLLPGYTESITADAWSTLAATDVSVIGLGDGTNRSTLNWTVAGSTLLFDVANFMISNCVLNLCATAATTVAAPITISAPGANINNCFISWGVSATQIVGIGITTTAAADYLTFANNYAYATALAVPTTTFLRLTGTDYLKITDSTIIGPGSTTAIGPVQQLTTAGLGSEIRRSIFQSTLAASTISFTAIAGCTGTVDSCSFGVLAAGNGLTTGSGLQVTNSYTAVAGAAGVATTG